MKVAVIGGGIAGMGAAQALRKAKAEVTLFEKDEELGGDAFAVRVHSWDGAVHAVDGGVSDFNRATFPRFDRFLEELGVARRSISREAGFLGHETGDPRLVYFATDDGKLTFWQPVAGEEAFRAECARFRREVCDVLKDDAWARVTAREYLDRRGHTEVFRRLFFVPRAKAAFLTHDGPAEDMPIRVLAAFWRYHAIVGEAAPERMCLVGGMSEYCRKFAQVFTQSGGQIRRAADVFAVSRSGGAVTVRSMMPDGATNEAFDHVILATKPCDALAVLDDASEAERRLLSKVPFRKDLVVIHTDERLLPRSKRSWGAFNLSIAGDDRDGQRPTITFWQNRLAVIDKKVPDVFVTLNPRLAPEADRVIAAKVMTHPLGTFDALWGKGEWDEIQGKGGVWFAGSYLEAPFLHENALATGERAAEGVLARRSVGQGAA